MADHVGKIFGTLIHTKISFAPAVVATGPSLNQTIGSFLADSSLIGARTDTAPYSETVNNLVGKHMPAFSDDFYNRILIEPSTVNVGNLASQQIRTLNVFNGYFTQKTLTNVTKTNAEGIAVAGLAFPNIFAPLASKAIFLDISTAGPATIDAAIAFNWSTPADNTIVGVKGVRLVSMPYQAEAPWNESLEWMTTVITSNNGKEQRRRLRTAPRQFFSTIYTVKPEELAKAYNLVQGWKYRIWAVPIWSEAQFPAPISAGQIEIFCVTNTSDLREGGMVALWEGNNKLEVLQILTVNTSSITLKVGAVSSYFRPTLVPVRSATVDGNITRQSNGSTSVLKVNFRVAENKQIPTVAPQQYKNEDIYFNRSLLSGEYLTDSVVSRDDIVDYGTGNFVKSTPWAQAKQARNVRYLQQGLANTWALRQFFHRRAGKLKPFWYPNFENNMTLISAGLLLSSIDVYSDTYAEMIPYRKDLAIQLTDGTWLTNTITATENLPNGVLRVALSTPLNLQASSISLVTFLILQRLDTDRVEFLWRGNAVAEASVSLMELI